MVLRQLFDFARRVSGSLNIVWRFGFAFWESGWWFREMCFSNSEIL